MIVKVCGMREGNNIYSVETAGADLMGFICWPESKRNVSVRPSYLPSCPRVGIFVHPTIEQVLAAHEMLSLDYVQLHGNECASLCKSIKDAAGLKLIKAISVSQKEDVDKWMAYQDVADLFLFDTKCPSVGGSGRQFDWDILQVYRGTVPFLLSGGIGPGDWERLLAWGHPQCVGIDVNSCFELSPALKDVHALKEFIGKIKKS